jgi:pSer/pThr/pTyr-binding forkhead associated (FHA) protein
MPVLQAKDQRFTLKRGLTRVGAGVGVDVSLDGATQGVHALLEMGGDERVVIRRSGESTAVRVNGITLGPEPTPLIHGDKVEIGGHELLFAEDAKGGETQFVSAGDLGAFTGKRVARARPTGATGGRLISLVDGKEYEIPQTGVCIGRDASCEVVVAQNEVSRRHAEIVPEEHGYVVRDLSTNGVYVNGERVSSAQKLSRADVVRVGSEEFRFYADVPRAEPAPTAAPAPAPATAPAAAAAPAPTPAPAPMSAPAPERAASLASRVVMPVSTVRPSDAPVLALLEIVNEGVDKGKRFEIRTPLAHVGRGAHNDVAIANESVSDVHAKLMLREDGWYVADLGSTNGTYVSGTRITDERRLEGTPDVRFGGVKAIFRVVGAPSGDPMKGTRAIASMNVERAMRMRDAAASAPPPAAERRTSPLIWVLLVAAAAVTAYLLLNR